MKLTVQEIGEIRIMTDIIKRRQWELGLVSGNTAFVPHGQDWCKQQEAIINLLNNEKEAFVRGACVAKGIEGKVSLDLSTGEIIQHDESKDSSTTS